jgi:hypothetical protein
MIKYLISLILTICVAAFSYGQRTDIQKVATVTQLKAYNGTAAFVFVSDSMSLYTTCSPCTPDEVYVFAGTGGKSWKVMARGIMSDEALVKYTDTAQAFEPYKNLLDTKVDKVSGKGLSTNDFTSDEKQKLADVITDTSRPDIEAAINARATTTYVNNGLSSKVDKITGKGLSTEDFTTTEKTKLANIAANATANSTDAQLRDRSTHTGTQPQNTVANLPDSLANKQNKGLTASKIAFLANSEFAAGWGGPRMDSLILTGSDTLIGNTIKNHAVGGHTIAQQQALYLADPDRANYNCVVLAAGLNDVWNSGEAASVALGRYQTLVNNIRTNSPKATIIVCAMQPVRKVYFANNNQSVAQAMYAKWYQMNQGIMGVGPNAITNVDYRIDEHVKALGDSIGNLASIYDVGDFLHTNTAGRKIVASVLRKALNQAGYLNNRTFSQPDPFLNFADSNVAVLKVPHFQIAGSIRAINTPVSATVADSVLYRNPTTGVYEMRKLPAAGGTGDVIASSSNNFSGNNTVTNTGSWTFYNTTDQSTNTEYARHSWVSNAYTIDANKLGTGSLRNMVLKANGATITIGTHAVAGGAFDVDKTGAFLNTFSVRGTNTLNANIFSARATYPTINQNGTATYVCDFMAPYEQTLGGSDNYFSRYMLSGSPNAGGPYTFKYHLKTNGDIWTAGGADIDGSLNVDGGLTVAGAITNTSLTNAINAKANANDAALTGVPTAPTATSGTNTNQIATTAFVASAVASGGVTLDATPTDGNTTNAVTSDGVYDALQLKQNLSEATKTYWFSGPIVNSTTTYVDVTGFSFPVVSGKVYEFKFTCIYSSAAQTTGAKWSIQGPAFSQLDYYSQNDNNGGLNFWPGLQTYDDVAIVGTTTSKTAGGNSNRAVVEGYITASANGNVILRFASKVAASAITARIGSVKVAERP